tara:strand:- start:132337 stop:133314 length:978 start_codon:yes stop_codon:yes gene_type:complete
MKKIKIIVAAVLFIALQNVNAQEKKIKFNKGTLKICSSKNFQITGYDGDEVVIKSLHSKRGNYSNSVYTVASKLALVEGTVNRSKSKNGVTVSSSNNKNQNFVYFANDGKRKKGLKKLGKKNENSDLGIYFTIEEKNGELIFRDHVEKGSFVMHNSNESYEIKIPNSIKLDWTTGKCENVEKEDDKENNIVLGQIRFYNSKASSLSNFNGEVEISTSLSNMKLTDVSGPVSINSLGGNVTIEFDKKKPLKLYSIYTNNGFIDIEIPNSSSILVDAQGRSIYSDIDFSILNEVETDKSQEMKLKLNSGKVRMKLDAGHGNIYLRKK